MGLLNNKRPEIITFLAKVADLDNEELNSISRHWAVKDAREYAKSVFTRHEIFLLKLRHPFLREILDDKE